MAVQSKIDLKAPPTNFFTLPRELRQQILLNTYDANVLRDPDLLATTQHYTWPPHYWNHREHVKIWATALREVSSGIVEDVDFVEKKWLENLEELRHEESSWEAWRSEHEGRFRKFYNSAAW